MYEIHLLPADSSEVPDPSTGNRLQAMLSAQVGG